MKLSRLKSRGKRLLSTSTIESDTTETTERYIPYDTQNTEDGPEEVNSDNEVLDEINISLDALSYVDPVYMRKEATESQEQNHETKVKINTKALPMDMTTYALEKFEKNLLLIFNHVKINGYDKPRSGTEKDVEALEKTFKNHGFEVKTENNLNKEDIINKMNEFDSQDFTDYGCIAVAILTHGASGGQIMAKDMQYSEFKIIEYLLARGRPTLVTKPRILIVQACRGKKCTKPVSVNAEDSYVEEDFAEDIQPYTLPAESDLLLLHSSYPGKASGRFKTSGSLFIQSLCKNIDKYSATLDLESIFRRVKFEIAILEAKKKNKVTEEREIFKQMPVSTSTLIRKLYFHKVGQAALSTPDSFPCSSSQGTSEEPNTPNLIMDSCSCYLHHFQYMKKCLAFYVEEHSEDKIAKDYLNIANKLEEDDSAKEATARAICNHLKINVEDKPAFKCLYLYDYNR